MTHDEDADIAYALSTVLYPEFDFLVDTYRERIAGIAQDSLSTFITWMAFTRSVLKKKYE